jgi:hypothetical protein
MSSAATVEYETIQDAPPGRLFENANGPVSEWMGVLAETTKRYTNGEIDRAGRSTS